MKNREEVKNYVAEIKLLFLEGLPEVSRQIKVYETKKAKGSLTKKPLAAPQFES